MRLLREDFGRISSDCIILGVDLRTIDKEVGKWDREGKEDSTGMLKSMLVGWAPGVKSDVGLLGDCVGHPMSCLPEQKGSQSICSTTPFPCCQGLTPRGSPSPGTLSFGTWSLILGPEKSQACLSVKLLMYIPRVKLKNHTHITNSICYKEFSSLHSLKVLPT